MLVYIYHGGVYFPGSLIKLLEKFWIMKKIVKIKIFRFTLIQATYKCVAMSNHVTQIYQAIK